MKKLLAPLLAFLLVMGLCPAALADDPQKGNTINPIYAPGGSAADAGIMAAANAAVNQFWAIDAYGNHLDDEVTIASGGSFFVGFLSGIDRNNPNLFWNVGWNLSTLARAGFVYENQIPAAENNFIGGIHIDTSANAGNTVYLDFYICKKPIDWNDIDTNKWVIQKVIQITVVDGASTASGAAGSASFQKPIPEGYSLSVADTAPDPLYVQPGGAAAKAVDLTVKTGASGDYPITRNDLNVTIDLPDGLAGFDSYVAKYVNPYTGAVEVHPATVANDKLQFGTDHLSAYVIEGYNAAGVPQTGDGAPLAQLAVLLLLSGAGLIVTGLYRKRSGVLRK